MSDSTFNILSFDGGVDRGQYPQPRTFLFGVNVNL